MALSAGVPSGISTEVIPNMLDSLLRGFQSFCKVVLGISFSGFAWWLFSSIFLDLCEISEKVRPGISSWEFSRIALEDRPVMSLRGFQIAFGNFPNISSRDCSQNLFLRCHRLPQFFFQDFSNSLLGVSCRTSTVYLPILLQEFLTGNFVRYPRKYLEKNFHKYLCKNCESNY